MHEKKHGRARCFPFPRACSNVNLESSEIAVITTAIVHDNLRSRNSQLHARTCAKHDLKRKGHSLVTGCSMICHSAIPVFGLVGGSFTTITSWHATGAGHPPS
jgi:hypothetical protein